jgi:hypothetical protein
LPKPLIEHVLGIERGVAQLRVVHELVERGHVAVLDEAAQLTVRLQDEVVAPTLGVQVEHHLVDRLGVLVHLDHHLDAGTLLELAFQLVHGLEGRQRLADRPDRRALVGRGRFLQAPGGGAAAARGGGQHEGSRGGHAAESRNPCKHVLVLP